VSDHGRDRKSEGVLIPFPDPSDAPTNVGPFCEKCKQRHFARSEGRGKCGHPIFLAGVRCCARCALQSLTCRACGADITGLMRRLKEDRENQNRRPKPGQKSGDKSRMKLMKHD
jgi:hypothetical protein